MKTFDVKMLGSDADFVSAHYLGQGTVSFAIKKRTMKAVVDLRRTITEKASTLGENPDNVAANVMLYELAVMLVRTTLTVKMNDDQATLLITNCGGIRGELVFQLAKKFGVADILTPGRMEEGEADEIPI